MPVRSPPAEDIAIDEASAWEVHPQFREAHNKLWICASQGLAHGPHGVSPPRYPVSSKPRRDMGTGTRVLRSRGEYQAALVRGHMWMRLQSGSHRITDGAVLRGEPKWWRHATAKPIADGTFGDWHVEAARKPGLERKLSARTARQLVDLTGIVNFETIGGRIFECYLRLSEQWIDFNGGRWIEAVTELYSAKR